MQSVLAILDLAAPLLSLPRPWCEDLGLRPGPGAGLSLRPEPEPEPEPSRLHHSLSGYHVVDVCNSPGLLKYLHYWHRPTCTWHSHRHFFTGTYIGVCWRRWHPVHRHLRDTRYWRGELVPAGGICTAILDRHLQCRSAAAAPELEFTAQL
jgi:hypothetical protein